MTSKIQDFLFVACIVIRVQHAEMYPDTLLDCVKREREDYAQAKRENIYAYNHKSELNKIRQSGNFKLKHLKIVHCAGGY